MLVLSYLQLMSMIMGETNPPNLNHHVGALPRSDEPERTILDDGIHVVDPADRQEAGGQGGPLRVGPCRLVSPCDRWAPKTLQGDSAGMSPCVVGADVC